MLKLTTEHQPFDTTYSAPPAIKSTRRLVVPIQNPEADPAAITQRLWKLAKAHSAAVKLVGLCQDTTQESYMRRTTVTMATMLNYANVTTDIEIVPGKDWVNAVKSSCRAGDMVVCWNDGPTGLLRKPFSQLLQSELDVPIYVLSGADSLSKSRSNWMSQIAAWIGFAVIILSFLALQIKIYQLVSQWTITFELLSTAVEFWLISVWNNKCG